MRAAHVDGARLCTMSEHELVIRNGLVVDGTGNAPRRADVAVDGGIITEVGFAPAKPTAEQHDWLIGMLEGVEDIPGTALAEGLAWDWETFPEYMDALDRRQFVLDVATQVAHAPLRAYVMGERGADHTIAPSADELARMADVVREALEAGAIGFATSRTEVHR